MSVMDEKIIDFAGIDKNENNLILSIADHLEWGVEADDVHLLMLQNKINDYLRFIESGEVNEQFKPEDYDKIIIRVITKYPFGSDCIKFLNMSKPVINDAGFGFEWEVRPVEDEG
jgi:hypothetical protein